MSAQTFGDERLFGGAQYAPALDESRYALNQMLHDMSRALMSLMLRCWPHWVMLGFHSTIGPTRTPQTSWTASNRARCSQNQTRAYWCLPTR